MPDADSKLAALRAAAEASPQDPRAIAALGDGLHQAGRHAEAIACWETAARVDRAWALPWRRLGMAYFNGAGDKVAAKGAYQRAFKLQRSADILSEIDALLRATGSLPQERLEELEKHSDLVRESDALRVAAAAALNLVGRFDHARGLLLERAFTGPEAAAGAGLFRRAEIALQRQAMWRGDDTRGAWEALQMPLAPFGNVPPGAEERAELGYWQGIACRKAQAFGEADRHWTTLAQWPRETAVADFYAGLALRELGRSNDADRVFAGLEESSIKLLAASGGAETYAGPAVAASPIKQEGARLREIHARFIEALARFGLREAKQARRLLGDVLRDDPNHALAADFMLWLDWQM